MPRRLIVLPRRFSRVASSAMPRRLISASDAEAAERAAQQAAADRAGADLFFVRCRDGSLACVRLLRRDWPTTTFEYVWQPKP